MAPDSTVLTSIAAVALTAVACAIRGRGGAPTGVALASALALGAWIAPAASAETTHLIAALALALLAYRLGLAARRGVDAAPTSLLVALAIALAGLGPPLLAGALRRVPQLEGAAVLALVIGGALLTIPDGSEDGRDRIDRRPTSFLRGVVALLTLPLLELGLTLGPRTMPALRGAGETSIGPALAALVAVAGLGLAVARLPTPTALRGALDDSRGAGGAIRALLATLAGAWIAPGSEALAALVAGVASPRRGAGAPSPRTDGSSPSFDAAWLALPAIAFALGGSAWRALDPGWDEALLGAGLWAAALVLRTLIAVALAGAWRIWRPSGLSWRWILSVPLATHPGALGLSWLIARLGLDAGEGALLARALVPALALSLLVEGGILRALRGPRALAGHELWELARGRLLAVRSAETALEHLRRRGDLETLTPMEHDRLASALRQRRLLAEVECEELLYDHPELRVRGRETIESELARSTVHALEEAARSGLLSAAALEALRAEVVEWSIPDDPILAEPERSGPLPDRDAGGGAS